MRIQSIQLRNFRNIQEASLHTDKQFIVLYGPNGAGKTSILEAVYMLSSLRSFRDPSPLNLIKFGEVSTFVEANVQTFLGKQKMVWGCHSKKDGRFLQIDKKNIRDLEVWFQCLRAILFCPEHIEIVKGGPQTRRSFIDRARFVAQPSYLQVVRKYLSVLHQKRELLKKDKVKDQELMPWNKQLIEYGTQITLERQNILRELEEPFQQMHQYIAGDERVKLTLRGIGSSEPEGVKARLEQLTEKVKIEEIRRRQSLVGPHRDDLDILLNDVPAKRFASQGQTRSIVLALKLAELEASHKRGDTPLFLLDDLSSELDFERLKKLVQMLSERDGQVWITTTNPNFLGALPKSRVARFYVEEGNVTLDR